ncbi:MAG: RNA-guided pseudouridylation complex pseudouridine synthase subunit Cbf5 [Candidatus Caldarchaeum sp.]|nr:RNA-guided pseudouridylation complex pseudouridine synthase subunit Cbf5 [Candidatus Caldarchaeales archaeon]
MRGNPAVSGVLPLLLNEATKLSHVFMHGGKEYVGLMELHGDVTDEKLMEAFKIFTGDIYQVPPVRASVARRPRIRRVYYFDVIERDGRYVLFRIGCSGGTYVRKICHDIGLYLGVGAHMEELRRTRAGSLEEKHSVTLLQVYEAIAKYRETGDEKAVRKVVHPVEKCLELLPKVYILDTAVDAVCHGADLMVAGVSMIDSDVAENSEVALMTLKNELVALGKATMNAQSILEASEGMAVDVTRVIMHKSTYPPVWKGGLQRVQ